MKLISDKGFNSISLDNLDVAIDNIMNNNKKYFALTFDGGYIDTFTNAFPILTKYGFNATVFLVSDYVGGIKQWGDSPTSLMTWEQAKEMLKYGILSNLIHVRILI